MPVSQAWRRTWNGNVGALASLRKLRILLSSYLPQAYRDLEGLVPLTLVVF